MSFYEVNTPVQAPQGPGYRTFPAPRSPPVSPPSHHHPRPISTMISLFCLFFKRHIKITIKYIHYSVWLLWFNTPSVRFNHISPWSNRLSFCRCENRLPFIYSCCCWQTVGLFPVWGHYESCNYECSSGLCWWTHVHVCVARGPGTRGSPLATPSFSVTFSPSQGFASPLPDAGLQC